jgi:hypothetical protein
VPARDDDDYVIMSKKVMTHHLNNWLLWQVGHCNPTAIIAQTAVGVAVDGPIVTL